MIGGSSYLTFAGCDYLGLSHDPALLAAFGAGLQRFGLGANGSRETSGNTLTHERLERALAAFMQTEAAVLCPDGALANLASCQWLALRYRVAFVERRAHASLNAAARAAGFAIETFEQTDLGALEQRLRSLGRHGLVVTDTVFAADGAQAPLRALAELARANESGLLLDDCHGLGVFGDGGRGSFADLGAPTGDVLITATLAKAFGCAGGICAGTAAAVEGIRAHAWAYRGTTPVAPAMAAAALTVVERLAHDTTLLERLRANIRALRVWFVQLGLSLPAEDCPIFAFCPSDAERVARLQAGLQRAQIWIPYVDYPGTAFPQYFRLALNAAHTQAEIQRLGQVLAECLA